MTQCRFFMQSGVLTGFELKGHTGANHSGEDIVCAAVSSAAYMTANTLTEMYGFSEDAVTVKDGFLRVALAPDGAKRCRELLEGFRLHLIELQKQYPQNIQVKLVNITEV